MPPTLPDAAPSCTEPPAPRHTSRARRPFGAALGLARRLARWAVGVVLVAWSVLLLAWAVLYGAILPHADEWRGQVETRATQALGIPVRIGRIEVDSRGWVPALRLNDVVLFDARGREALRLPQVSAAVSARSLLAFSLRFEQLLIDGADLEVRRDAQGRLSVAGLVLQHAPGEARGSGGEAADWFFEQYEFVIRHGRVRWVDEFGDRRGLPPLALEDVDLVLRNGLRRHALRLDATPPADWGRRFTVRAQFRQPLLARSGDWQRWSGSVYAELPQADVAQLRQRMALPFELDAGEGALRAWVDIDKGRPVAATADLALNAVSLRLAKGLQPLELALLQGRFSGTRDTHGVTLKAEDLRFVTGDGQRWLPSKLQVAWTQRQDRPDAPVTGGRVSADRLDLGLMAGIAERLPLGQAVQQLLQQTRPQGQVHDLAASWQGPLDAPQRYQVDTRLAAVSVAPGDTPPAPHVGRPGWRNADVELHASETGGNARLSMQGGALTFPGLFAEPELPLDRFDARIDWRITHAKAAKAPKAPKAPSGVQGGAADAALPLIELQVKNAVFANADAAGELQAAWHTGPGAGTTMGAGQRFPGVLDLSGKLSRGQGTAVARYLPLSLPKDTREYVAHAVQAGRVDAASFKVRGDLWNFPYASHPRDGEFRINGRVSGVTLAYVPTLPGHPASPWPAFTDVEGELVFDRAAMQIRNARARVGGFELAQVNGGIADMEHQSTLVIEGNGRGPLPEALRYVNGSPVGEWIGHALQHTQAAGPAELRLALSLPFEHMDRATVKGRVTLPGNELRLRPDVPAFGQVRGKVDFTQQGFTLQGVSARALGGELQIDGGTVADGSTRLHAQGTASAEGLRRAGEVPGLARLASVFSGQAPYRLQLGIVKGQTEFTLTSPLTGLGIDLPAPLNKAADTPLPLRVQAQLQADTLATAAPRDTLRVELGSLAQAVYQRDLSGPSPQVLRGALALQDSLPAPQPGVVAQANVNTLDVDAWQQALERWSAPAAPGVTSRAAGLGVAPGAGGRSVATASLDDGAAAYLPQLVQLRAQSLRVGGRPLTRVAATLQRLPAPEPGWRSSITAEQLHGDIEVRQGGTLAGTRVKARLSRLSLPAAEGSGGGTSAQKLLEQPPAQMPSIDLVIDELDLGGKRLGRLELDAVQRGPELREAAREWHINRLLLSSPDAVLTATGQWSPASALQPRRRMGLNFRLDINDSGGLLQRLGTPGALKGGKGSLEGQVSWLGAPWTLDYPSLNGRMKLALDEGQFLKAGAGAGRLLGVLSLQSLPRRLLLDFRDVFQQGFAFDQLGGDIQIEDGVARSENLRMRGVQAVVVMAGQADLERETHDLRVVVVPEVNAGAASLAYAAINPAVGLGTFVAQLVLRKPLMAAGTREFHVTGSWDDPKVERVERKFGEPVPEIASGDAPSSPSPSAAASAPVPR